MDRYSFDVELSHLLLHAGLSRRSEIARSIDVSASTVARYLDALDDALVVRRLQPWHANVAKRQVKSAKVYVRDSGLLHRLLGLDDLTSILGHPKAGASWEGFVLLQVVALPGVSEPWFWGTHQGAGLDLIVTVGNRRIGIEIKRTDRPRMTPSIRHALDDLDLDRILVVHAGRQEFPISDRVSAVPAADLTVQGFAGRV